MERSRNRTADRVTSYHATARGGTLWQLKGAVTPLCRLRFTDSIAESPLFSLRRALDSVLRSGAHGDIYLLLFGLRRGRCDITLSPVAHGLNPIRSGGSTSARRAVLRVPTDETSALLLRVRVISSIWALGIPLTYFFGS